jgi:hypothetical protein
MVSPASPHVYEIVVDIDGTIVSNALYNEAPCRDTFCCGPMRHQLGKGAVALLAALAHREDVRISFFSAGDASRNRRLVQMLGQRVAALGVPEARWQLVDVWSRQHLSGAGAKDLTQLPRPYHLPNTLLIDDTWDVVPEGQDDNVLQVGPGASGQSWLLCGGGRARSNPAPAASLTMQRAQPGWRALHGGRCMARC